MDTTVPITKKRRAYPDTPEGRAKHAERMREWHKRHPNWRKDNWAKKRSEGRTWSQMHPGRKKEYDRWYQLRRKFGLSREQFQKMWDRQKGQCPICLDPLPDSPHVDHDHDTNRVRGLTCGSCNRFVLAKPDIEKFKRSIRYLGGGVNES